MTSLCRISHPFCSCRSVMDRISQLPEHLLLRILSLLPSTKDVVDTMVLSKRWQFLWTLVPRLVYDGIHQNTTKETFSKFVDRSLLLHEAPVLDYLQFRLGWKSSDVDNIGVWARAVSRHSGNILSSISPVRVLYLRLSSLEDAYPSSGCIFHRLVDFKLCRCERQWLDLLMCVLRDSPKLRTLKLVQYGYQADDPNPCWSEPSLVPECLLSSLETLECESYEGTKKEKEVVEYILRNGRCLRKVTISSRSTDSNKKIKELALSFRSSPICQVVFN
ncbi:probable FBD-associated F-box protein At1g32375 isoform X2 [Raphanus sativus]|uniref:Probable FBD-associated F-box protein At1g32375 isoform X2 n=1 Tax=Raphanus sativus TaxID=3726 RepID=A0A9W3D9Y3_RAPSA|nr:probable FBD-associated F-box protein At1g32375 isoform X2 [Raphanus sativus]